MSEDIPEAITWPLRSYLGELPGYDPELPLDKQRDNKPSEQHGYAQFYFTPMFTQIGGSLGTSSMSRAATSTCVISCSTAGSWS